MKTTIHDCFEFLYSTPFDVYFLSFRFILFLSLSLSPGLSVSLCIALCHPFERWICVYLVHAGSGSRVRRKSDRTQQEPSDHLMPYHKRNGPRIWSMKYMGSHNSRISRLMSDTALPRTTTTTTIKVFATNCSRSITFSVFCRRRKMQ